ncbi:hypothetical protein BO71DRAFT_51675 [Aspergillus ellipticus CBS 707.79]|uniref:Uncharacterized protein n=1 Tax=Aspergillus ellipticus CBS 707.79 TaxID=1448320 RepID=A0A319D1I1_9EURO|nr:hypothetical protein BO71DRAFT_51675 [Aspergillus ellipticus CBS 707.79]
MENICFWMASRCNHAMRLLSSTEPKPRVRTLYDWFNMRTFTLELKFVDGKLCVDSSLLQPFPGSPQRLNYHPLSPHLTFHVLEVRRSSCSRTIHTEIPPNVQRKYQLNQAQPDSINPYAVLNKQIVRYQLWLGLSQWVCQMSCTPGRCMNSWKARDTDQIVREFCLNILTIVTYWKVSI